MRAALALSLCAPLLLASGCFRYQTRVPGVVDLRSDASDVPRAAPEAPADDDLARPDGVAFLMGEGVRTYPSDGSVTVEDRHVFVRGLIPAWNTSAEEELAAALALSGGLADVTLGEEVGPVDVVLTVLASFVPIVSWIGPSTYTFIASGEALALKRPAPPRLLPPDATDPPLPPDPVPPAAPTTPTPPTTASDPSEGSAPSDGSDPSDAFGDLPPPPTFEDEK